MPNYAGMQNGMWESWRSWYVYLFGFSFSTANQEQSYLAWIKVLVSNSSQLHSPNRHTPIHAHTYSTFNNNIYFLANLNSMWS